MTEQAPFLKEGLVLTLNAAASVTCEMRSLLGTEGQSHAHGRAAVGNLTLSFPSTSDSEGAGWSGVEWNPPQGARGKQEESQLAVAKLRTISSPQQA